MSEDELIVLETYRELKPELKQDVLSYSRGFLACQRRLESRSTRLGAPEPVYVLPSPKPVMV